MKINNLQFLTVFIGTMFSSCINDIPYDAEIGAPKLVLNALLMPDSTLTAAVSHTVHFLDYEAPRRLSDATVIATVNGSQVPLAYDALTRDYRSTLRLAAGDEVALIASHPLGTAAAAQCVMKPTPISIIGTTVQPFVTPGDPVSIVTIGEVDSAMLVSLHIDDPVDETNYYRMTIDYRGSYEVNHEAMPYLAVQGTKSPTVPPHNSLLGRETTVSETFYPHYLLTESSSRLIVDSESVSQLFGSLLYMTSANSFVFSDKHLRGVNGQPIIDFFMLMERPCSNNVGNDMYDPESGWVNGDDYDFIFPADTVTNATYHYRFILETLSEDYYHYLTTVSAYYLTGVTMVSEPVRIHSNVNTGVGIVGSYSTVSLEDSVITNFELSDTNNCD